MIIMPIVIHYCRGVETRRLMIKMYKFLRRNSLPTASIDATRQTVTFDFHSDFITLCHGDT